MGKEPKFRFSTVAAELCGKTNELLVLEKTIDNSFKHSVSSTKYIF